MGFVDYAVPVFLVLLPVAVLLVGAILSVSLPFLVILALLIVMGFGVFFVGE